MKLFQRKKKRSKEITPQLTVYERRGLEFAGHNPGRLPDSTYSQMEGDSMIQTALTIKKLAVLAAPWSIEPASDSPADREKAEFVADVFDQMDGSPNTILLQAMDAFSKGWSVQEIVYLVDGGKLKIRAVRAKNPSYFGLDIDEFGRIQNLKLQIPGIEERSLPTSKFVIYVNRKDYAQPKGRSDLDAAHEHWSTKQTLLKAWQLHLEKFAMPTVLGQYERGIPADERSAILKALQDLQDNTAIVYPSEISITTLGGNKEPSSGFQEAIEFHNREMARAVLGQTLTTDEGRRVGSLALGKVHLQVLLLQIAALRRELADVVMTEQIIQPLVEANFGPGTTPRFEFEDVENNVFRGGRL
ncbi:MAG: DUF935 family protein [Armatimonadetes bacterium]|nr:DUF935 family protein [Armatimonadota bacterium]